MGKNIYVGNRYVPKVVGVWDNTKNTPYESLSIVLWAENSYTSKKNVPIGIDITNTDYWVVTGNYNGQVELYRQEVSRYASEVEQVSSEVELKQNKNDSALITTSKTIVGAINENNSAITNNKDSINLINQEINSSKEGYTTLKEKFNSKKDKNKYVISVHDYGAIGDGVHDDTSAFKQAIQKAKTLVNINRVLTEGVTITLDGGRYLITETLLIDESGIFIEGVTYGSSTIISPNFNDVLIKFERVDNTPIYRSGVRNITINTLKTIPCQPTHILMTKPVYCEIENVVLSSWYNGIVINKGGKVFINNCILQQDQVAELWNCGLDLDGSDIHITDVQVIPNKDNGDYSIRLRNIDGIYFENCHQHGGINIIPPSDGGAITALFTNHYIDTSKEILLNILPTKDYNIKEIKFVNSMITASKYCVVFSGNYKTGTVKFLNTCFKQAEMGIRATVNNKVEVIGCTFDRMSKDDLLLLSDGNIVVGNRFISTDATKAEANINIVSPCIDNIICDNNFIESNSSVKIRGNIRSNNIRNNIGYSMKESGSSTTGVGTFFKQIVTTLSTDLQAKDITVTPLGDYKLYVNNVSGKNFQVNSDKENSSFAWSVNAER